MRLTVPTLCIAQSLEVRAQSGGQNIFVASLLQAAISLSSRLRRALGTYVDPQSDLHKMYSNHLSKYVAEQQQFLSEKCADAQSYTLNAFSADIV